VPKWSTGFLYISFWVELLFCLSFCGLSSRQFESEKIVAGPTERVQEGFLHRILCTISHIFSMFLICVHVVSNSTVRESVRTQAMVTIPFAITRTWGSSYEEGGPRFLFV
jgi:uncharacterized membrane protein